MKNKRNEVEAVIPEVECKSLQGDCMEEEKEGECTSKFFGGDLQITKKDVGSCMGEEASFGSDPKEDHKSELQLLLEPHKEEENKATSLGCEPTNLVEEQATKGSL